MNIFFVDRNPEIAAKSLVDKHVVKMILESAQLLSTSHRVLDGEESTIIQNNRRKKVWALSDARENVIYKATHINHPSAIWVRETIENYAWLVDHFYSLMDEYTYRYKKIHKCCGELSYMLSSPPLNLKYGPLIDPPCAMPVEYIISDDPVINYRNYYNIAKKDLHNWKNRLPPMWITGV